MLDWCRRAALYALALALAFLACQEEETRPGLAQDCNDPACLAARGDSFLPLPSGPGGGAAGAAGAAGGGGMPDADGELSGTVLEIAAPDLVMSQSLRGEVEVRAPSATGGDDVVTQPGADGFYTLEGIARGAGIWVGVGNFADPPLEPFIDTLQAVDSGRSGFTNLVVLRRDTLSEVAATAFLNSSVELAPDGAHIVLAFVNSQRQPVEGVQITFPTPDDVSTAYDAGDTYSDALQQTSTRGMAILLNLDAPPWPGTPLGIVADIDGEQLSAQVQIARGAVTVVTAVVPDP
jgi:hypothetical protein